MVFPDGFRFGATAERSTIEPHAHTTDTGLNKDPEHDEDTKRLRQNSITQNHSERKRLTPCHVVK